MTEQRKTILVVDDNPTNLAMLLRLLGKEGFEVLIAENGAEALNIARETIPELFLLDVMMPGMDGYTLCRRLKKDVRLADIPVIFVTAKNETDEIVRGFDAGAVDYITKPIRRAEVLARVRTHIRLHEALVEVERLRELALDANPLTKLPGNNTIAQTIQDAIDRAKPVTVIYADLDNFKAYNDKYSFSEGDRILKAAAQLFQAAIRSVCGKDEFVGHIGGDDFVIMVPSEHTRKVGEEIIGRFDQSIVAFYNAEDRERGYISTSDRQGNPRRFPIMSVSLAGVHLTECKCSHFLEVAAICAEVKK